MRPPSYAPRELTAIRAADRVVARVLVRGQWREQEFRPDPALGETTVRQCLARVQAALRHTPSLAGICLYVAAVVDGQELRASVSTDPLLVPSELH